MSNDKNISCNQAYNTKFEINYFFMAKFVIDMFEFVCYRVHIRIILLTNNISSVNKNNFMILQPHLYLRRISQKPILLFTDHAFSHLL